MKIIDQLPERWWLALTPEIFEDVQNWSGNKLEHATDISGVRDKYEGFMSDSGEYFRANKVPNRIQITTADFNAHILGKLPEKWCVAVTESNKPDKLHEWRGSDWAKPSRGVAYVHNNKIWQHSLGVSIEIPYSLFEKLVYGPWKRERSSEWGIDMAVENMRRTENHCTLTSTRPKATSMKDIKIPQQLLTDGDAAVTAPQRDFILKHYDPFKQTMPQDRVIEFYKEQVSTGCEWKKKLEEAFPFLVEKKDWKATVKKEPNYVQYNHENPKGFQAFYGGNTHLVKPEHTFSLDNASLLAKKIQLMVEMHKFAELRNQGWVPEFTDNGGRIFGITRKHERSAIDYWSTMNAHIFGIAFKTIEIANEALEIFGERINEIYNKQF